MSVMDTADVERAERALGWRPTSARSAAGDRGKTAAGARWIVSDARRSAFVKIGSTAATAEWLRTEHRNLVSIAAPFMPRVVGFSDDGRRPVLAQEDLSLAEWPPPWSADRIQAVLDALQAVRETAPIAALRPFQPETTRAWTSVAADPEPFLRLGLCSAPWLEQTLPALARAEADAPLAGEALVHGDVRSDNLCFRDGAAILIDWNHATIANPVLDVAFWLPSLHAEGGPSPEEILPDAPELAAWVAGYFCSRAGDPPIVEAPHVRPLQLLQSRTALPWAARALGLRPPS